MSTLIQFLEAAGESVGASSPQEIKYACELIIEVQAMSAAERDCIRASYERGPLCDGDVPSKVGRDKLTDRGYMAKIVVKGEYGYNACTYKGALAARLIAAGA